MALAGLVHCLTAASGALAQAPKPPDPAANSAAAPAVRIETLPPNVEDMREAILAAAQSGRVEDLKPVLEWNELPPDLGAEWGADPIAYLKKMSADGEGRELLAVLSNILAVGPATVPRGRDAENPAMYIWPYLAESDLSKLTPEQEVDLYRLMPTADAKAMREKNKWTWYRLVIGADGTWHSFKRD